MNKIVIGIGVLVVVLLGALVYAPKEEACIGGGGVGDYMATSTTASTGTFLATADPLLVKAMYGVLGSVIVSTTGTAGGTMNFYDATTTNALKRKSTMGTSSIIMLSLPTNLAAGVYNFDVAFANGLLVDFTGTPGTTTITYK